MEFGLVFVSPSRNNIMKYGYPIVYRWVVMFKYL